MTNPKGYFTEKDLIKRVAAKQGVTEKQAEFMYKFILKLIRLQAVQPHVLGVKIPHVGTIYQKKPPLVEKLRQSSDLFKKGTNYKRLVAKLEFLEKTAPTDVMTLHRRDRLVQAKHFTRKRGYKQYEIALNEMQDREKAQLNFK